jgi:hypothetical protein
MHTIELLDEAIALAEQVGYRVRHEWLDGTGGGECELRGQKCVFLDLAVDPLDQLELLLAVLRREPAVVSRPVPRELGELLAVRRSA